MAITQQAYATAGRNINALYENGIFDKDRETPDTAKEPPTDYRASSRPYHPGI
jgi:hypothetical protein